MHVLEFSARRREPFLKIGPERTFPDSTTGSETPFGYLARYSVIGLTLVATLLLAFVSILRTRTTVDNLIPVRSQIKRTDRVMTLASILLLPLGFWQVIEVSQ